MRYIPLFIIDMPLSILLILHFHLPLQIHFS
nr:MAG TPA: Protein of unknown function (DUF1375) [Caudoviricetes sp.]